MNSFRFTVLVLLLSVTNFIFSQQDLNSQFTVVIDPGHGGKDPGAVSNGYYEKIIALSITTWNHTHLKKNFFLTLSSYLDYFQWLCCSVSGISALCLNETPWRPTRSDGWMGQPPSWGKSRVNPSQELAASLRNSRFEGFRSRIREECRYWMHAFRFSMGELRK